MVGGTLADAGYSPRPGPRSGPLTWYAAPALAWCLVTFHSRHRPSGGERSCAAHRECRPADRGREPARGPERIRYVWYAQVGEDTTTVRAGFQGADPSESLVEVDACRSVFYPAPHHIDIPGQGELLRGEPGDRAPGQARLPVPA
ncbi:hypothetical protein [Actinomyces israelii]|uniref:hypothetical protein n=1 Tax=Actinomyces israelii TaxID=1659 RepID=UPI002B4C0E89|nr:hypothetical protein [Actinomyces israelii]